MTEEATHRIKQIEAITGNARTTWLVLIGLLAFAVIAIADVRDSDFFSYDIETQLPLLEVSVPVVTFLWSLPLLILVVYTYFDLILLKHWRALRAAPLKIGGQDIDDAIAPWLLSDAALFWRPNFPHRPFAALNQIVVVLVGWFAAPAVIMAFVPDHRGRADLDIQIKS